MNTVNASTASDRQWWNDSGNCGGCELDTCHPGQGCGTTRDDGTPGHTVCSMCPERHEQGFHERSCRCDNRAPESSTPDIETLPLFPITWGFR